MITNQYILKNLNCANCAAKIEKTFNDSPYCHEVILDFTNKKLSLIFNSTESAAHMNDTEVSDIIHHYEPDVSVIKYSDDIDIAEDEHASYKKYILGFGLISFLAMMVLTHVPSLKDMIPQHISIGVYLTIYLLVGHGVLKKSILGFKNGQLFDENFLMSVATIGAIILGEWSEAVAVMMFYEIGEAFQDKAVNHSRRSIKSLLNIKPDTAHLIVGNGGFGFDNIQTVNPQTVPIGANILVKPGEKIPLDGIIIKGESNLDTSALTGESMPRSVEVSDEVLSGSVNIDGTLVIKTTKAFGESTVFKILKLVENSAAKKSQTEKFITKFAHYYTPAVVFSAIAVATIPPLFFGEPWPMWIQRALIFLVVSCPCALVVSIPLGYFGGIGCASQKGILIKGGQYLDVLNSIDTVVFDKTGTLTTGTFKITNIHTIGDYSEDEILQFAYSAEYQSNHPIAKSIQNEAMARNIQIDTSSDIKEISGQGISTTVDNKSILVGNARLMAQHNIDIDSPDLTTPSSVNTGSYIYIAVQGILQGVISIADLPKEEAKNTLQQLKSMGIKHTQMLTGDSKHAAKLAFDELELDEFHAELLPADKVDVINSLINKGHKTAFIGDGVNDAPVLARADIGIAMGALGSDAAIEAADMVLMTDELSKLPEAIKISKFTRRVIIENITLALGVKLAVMLLGVIGIASMWMAVFADVGVAVIAIFNSMRILRA